jgi:hypothetical protein
MMVVRARFFGVDFLLWSGIPHLGDYRYFARAQSTLSGGLQTMTSKLRFVRGPVVKLILATATIAVLAPLGAQAKSSTFGLSPDQTCLQGAVCIDNGGGMATGGVGHLFSGLTMNGANSSTLTQIGTLQGSNLGTLTLTTGGLLSGSLANGGTFASGTITITNTVAYNGFTGVLFTGTFGDASNPIKWEFNGKVGNFYQYELVGPVSGTYEGSIPVSGETAQLFFESKTKYNGGPISLSTGTTTIITPEPASLGLMGTGLLGIALLVKRKVKNDQRSTEHKMGF